MKTARDFPYHFVLPTMPEQYKAVDWCMKNLGPRWSPIDNRNGIWACFWNARSIPKSYDWYFLNEKDATMFLLRWS